VKASLAQAQSLDRPRGAPRSSTGLALKKFSASIRLVKVISKSGRQIDGRRITHNKADAKAIANFTRCGIESERNVQLGAHQPLVDSEMHRIETCTGTVVAQEADQNVAADSNFGEVDFVIDRRVIGFGPRRTRCIDGAKGDSPKDRRAWSAEGRRKRRIVCDNRAEGAARRRPRGKGKGIEGRGGVIGPPKLAALWVTVAAPLTGPIAPAAAIRPPSLDCARLSDTPLPALPCEFAVAGPPPELVALEKAVTEFAPAPDATPSAVALVTTVPVAVVVLDAIDAPPEGLAATGALLAANTVVVTELAAVSVIERVELAVPATPGEPPLALPALPPVALWVKERAPVVEPVTALFRVTDAPLPPEPVLPKALPPLPPTADRKSVTVPPRPARCRWRSFRWIHRLLHPRHPHARRRRYLRSQGRTL
jgi:hypothetical protein